MSVAHLEQLALIYRDRGAEWAINGSHPDYREALWSAIESLARRGYPFCADDVRELAGPVPGGYSPNVVGAVVLAASKRGVIRFVDYTRSKAPQGHGNRVARWRAA